MLENVATTGKLRAMLMATMESIISGKMDAHQAHAIVKVAAQINVSLIAEAQIAKLKFLVNKEIDEIGTLPIEDERQKASTIEH